MSPPLPTKAQTRDVVLLACIGDIKFWSDRFGVNAAQLKDAVAKVGGNPDQVQRALRR